MKRTYDAEFFDGKCPYTGKPCYEWECNSCEVDAQESDYQRQVEQYQYDTLYEPTFDSETGSM